VALPENVLFAWSTQGSTSNSTDAYLRVQRAIANSRALSKGGVEVYLQGSYRNDTNVRRDSDVDVVVQSHHAFFSDRSALTPNDRAYLATSLPAAPYSWEAYRNDVLESLRSWFGGSSVEDRNKCVTVRITATGMTADVVPALDLRLYRTRQGSEFRYAEGMAFRDKRDGRLIANYPKIHYQNEVKKQQATQHTFKPMVRLVKNAKLLAVQRGLMRDELAPSYFVECLLYNVPNAAFMASSWADRTYAVLKWLQASDFGGCVCSNEVLPLFGETPEQWRLENAKAFVAALITLWNRA